MSAPFRILFTDLDGTLLDEQYRFEAARPAFQAVQAFGIPIVFCTSKTFAETAALQRALGVDTPFIVENGGAIYFRPGSLPATLGPVQAREGWSHLCLGLPYAKLAADLRRLQEETGIQVQGFSAMTVEEVAEACGLSKEEAARAKDRECDEPFRLVKPSEDAPRILAEAADRHGLKITRGGRFHHLTGAQDKGRAVRLVLGALGNPRSVGLGDSPNDLPMLQAVDLPILVQRPGGWHDPQLLEALPGAIRAQGIGPDGWNQAVLALLDQGRNHAQ